MKTRRLVPRLAALAAIVIACSAPAAINPAEFQRRASHHFELRELARVVHRFEVDGDKRQRITLVALVVRELETNELWAGRTIVIDYTVSLSDRERAARDFQLTQGREPGPQFMSEPEPPELDAEG